MLESVEVIQDIQQKLSALVMSIKKAERDRLLSQLIALNIITEKQADVIAKGEPIFNNYPA